MVVVVHGGGGGGVRWVVSGDKSRQIWTTHGRRVVWQRHVRPTVAGACVGMLGPVIRHVACCTL
jgi:hypothetical protein